MAGPETSGLKKKNKRKENTKKTNNPAVTSEERQTDEEKRFWKKTENKTDGLKVSFSTRFYTWTSQPFKLYN